MLICSSCKVERPATREFFYLNRARPTGFSNMCKSCDVLAMKKYKENNPENRKQTMRVYRENNKEKIDVYNREWRAKNPGKWAASVKRSQIKRRLLDPVYRESIAISAGINAALSGKNKRWWEVRVGYSVEELRFHLEGKFQDGMCWENYGSLWQIDHVKPVYFYRGNNEMTLDEVAEMLRDCWSLGNLQPLEKIKNQRKGYKADVPFNEARA